MTRSNGKTLKLLMNYFLNYIIPYFLYKINFPNTNYVIFLSWLTTTTAHVYILLTHYKTFYNFRAYIEDNLAINEVNQICPT